MCDHVDILVAFTEDILYQAKRCFGLALRRLRADAARRRDNLVKSCRERLELVPPVAPLERRTGL